MTISLIIPVYNVKDYLKRCVDSAIAQTYSDIDILLIDDGSTDGSGEMCDKLAKQDDRIRVIHQKNAGLSVARNVGIRNAEGEYILFLDSDDYISVDCCEKFAEILQKEEYDIIAADAYLATDKGIKPQTIDRSGIAVPTSGRVFLAECLKLGYSSMCAPFALYRKGLILDHALWFEPGLLHEDQLWTPQAYLAAEKVTYCRYFFYYHWVRQGSIGQSVWNKAHDDSIRFICKELYPIFYGQQEYRAVFLDYLCMLYMDTVNRSRDTDSDKEFMKKTAMRKKNIIKTRLYCFSPELYFKVNAVAKKLKIV